MILGLCKIPLTKGKFALVDWDDYEKVSAINWYAGYKRSTGTYYAENKTNGLYLSMHRFILGITDRNLIVDHKDYDTLDNRKNNLRICAHGQSLAHRKFNNPLGRGVSLYGINKFRAQVKYNNVKKHLGIYDRLIDAQIAYDLEAIKLFGEFAETNFPKENYLRSVLNA